MIKLFDKITKSVLGFLQAYPLQWLDRKFTHFQNKKEQAGCSIFMWTCLSGLQVVWVIILLFIALSVLPILLWKHFRKLDIPCHEHFRFTPYGEFIRRHRDPQEQIDWKQEGF